MTSRERTGAGDKAQGSVTARSRGRSGALAKGLVTTRCYRAPRPGAKRELIWEDVSENIVVNIGLDYLIQTGLANGTQISTWFAGLMYATPTVSATGTMASHAGWTECTVYSAAARPAWVEASIALGTLGNSASKAGYTISAAVTVGGVFLISTNTKGGTLGTLYSGVAFSGGDRSLAADDKLEVTYNQSVADDGA
jgi:hypothetical protein